jgi:hypothetical protein
MNTIDAMFKPTYMPAVVGMHGETGSELIKFLAMLAENY